MSCRLCRNALSKTELEVAELLKTGMPNKQIARTRGVGLGTIKNQVSAILSKTGVSNRAQFVATYRPE